MAAPALNSTVERLIAHGFFFFFVFEILSPQLGARTLYIEYFFVVFNPYFWHWFVRIRFNRKIVYAVLPAALLVPFHPISAIKLLTVFAGVSFLVYCYERRIFNIIKPYLFISIAFSIVQFGAVVFGQHALAYDVGPTNISSMLWGNLATPTNTNFYTIFYFPRVSGLSREAGFFASLIVSSYLAFFIHARLGSRKVARKLSICFVVPYILSFSKSSIALVLDLIIVKFRVFVDRIPLFLIGGVFLFALVVFWHSFERFLVLPGAITYLSRFGGYALLYDMNLHQLLFGVSDVQEIPGALAQFVSYQASNGAGLGGLAGIGGWCLHNGLLAFFLYMIGVQALGIRGAGFLLILLMTATVGIDTNQNFVLLAYYVAFMLSRLPEHSLAKRSHSRFASSARPALAKC